MVKEKVILGRLKNYDAGAIQDFTKDAIETLGVTSKPRVFIKPNAVQATRYAEHAYTHPEFLRGIFRGLAESGVAEQILYEDCGIAMPLRYVFRKAGYNRLCKDEGVRLLNLSEAVHDASVKVKGGEAHDELPLPSILLQDGLRVYAPKLKVHSQTDITGACKLMIGIIKRSIRLHRHHYDLGKKIADALAAYSPDLVLVDAITIGINGVGCPDPVNLGVVIAASNAVAADAVSAWLLGFDPREIEHLQLAAQRGLDPVDLGEIEIINPDKINPAASGAFEEKPINELNPYISYFEGEVNEGRHCRGGCIGFVAEAIHYINHYRTWRQQERVNFATRALFWLLGQEPSQERPRRLGVLVGEYQGEIPEELRNNIIFVGDCARANGIKPRVHLAGCPVYMARQAFTFAQASRQLNPYIDVMEWLPFIRAFVEERFMRGWNIITHPLRRKR